MYELRSLWVSLNERNSFIIIYWNVEYDEESRIQYILEFSSEEVNYE